MPRRFRGAARVEEERRRKDYFERKRREEEQQNAAREAEEIRQIELATLRALPTIIEHVEKGNVQALKEIDENISNNHIELRLLSFSHHHHDLLSHAVFHRQVAVFEFLLKSHKQLNHTWDKKAAEKNIDIMPEIPEKIALKKALTPVKGFFSGLFFTPKSEPAAEPVEGNVAGYYY